MVWHRPLLSTYGDNYRYGTSLYNGYSVGDAEKKYRESLSKTSVRSDRGDLGMYSFVGSHIHGGTPAVDSSKISAPASSGKGGLTSDLYAPMSFGYGREYYNNLRADYQKPRARPAKMPSASDYFGAGSGGLGAGTEPVGADLKTHTAQTKTSYDDAKKTVTTTTTTERWVPLSSYLHSYPAYYYHYSSTPGMRTSKTTDDVYYSSDTMDDYYKSTTTSAKSRTIDALDLNVSSSSMDKFDYNSWMEKCHSIHSQLEQVNRWIGDAEAKIKTDVVGARNKMQSELTEVSLLVEDTSKYNEELQRVIKRQARQITDLHSQYDDINRHLVDVNDTLEKSRVRCQSLASDLISVQSGLEMVARRK